MRRLAHTLLLLAAAGSPAAAWLAGPAAWAQADARSAESIKAALDVMSRVAADSGQLIASHRYDQLPRESNEFEAGLTELEQALGPRPSELKSKLEPLIAKARVASSAMSEAVRSHQSAMLPLAHRQLAQAVSAIIASFPAGLRPGAGG